MPAQRIFNDEDIERMKLLYVEAGYTSPDIARMMHCYPTTIRNYLRRAGVEIRPRGGSTPLRNVDHREMNLIKYLYCYKKWSINMIGEHLKVNPATVRHRMVAAGIPRRSSSETTRLAYRFGRRSPPRPQIPYQVGLQTR